MEYLDVWHEAYAAVMRYARGVDSFWVGQRSTFLDGKGADSQKFRQVSIHSGDPVYNTVDSLSAFWPGLQVLAGDIENAIKSHLICTLSHSLLASQKLILLRRLESLEKKFRITRSMGHQLHAGCRDAISSKARYVPYLSFSDRGSCLTERRVRGIHILLV